MCLGLVTKYLSLFLPLSILDSNYIFPQIFWKTLKKIDIVDLESLAENMSP